MFGDAKPNQFSRRIRTRGRFSQARDSIKKKTRRSAVKKRKTVDNSSLLEATKKTKLSRNHKLRKNKKKTSYSSPILKFSEKKEGKENKLRKISKPISKQTSSSLKLPVHSCSHKNIFEKRKTRNSLNASQVNFTVNKKQLNLELESPDKIKKVIDKKNSSDLKGTKDFVCKNLKVSSSSQLVKGKRINMKLNNNKLKSSRGRRVICKKCPLQESSVGSKSVFTSDSQKSFQTFRQSKRTKSATLFAKYLNKKNSLLVPTSKLLGVIPHSKLDTLTTHCSVRLSRAEDQFPILNSRLTLNTSAFQSNLETPNPEKHCKKRRSSRILEQSLLKTPNEKLSLSTPSSEARKSCHSKSGNSSKSFKNYEFLTNENRCGKRRCREIFNKKTTSSPEKLKQSRKSKQATRLGIPNSGITLNKSAFQSILETPQPEKHSKKRKSSRILEKSLLRTPNEELSLSTPAWEARKNRASKTDNCLKSCPSDKLAAENHGRKLSRCKVSKKEIIANSSEKLKLNPKLQVSLKKKISENFKMPYSRETENLSFDVLSTPAFASKQMGRMSKKFLTKSSKRKSSVLSTEKKVGSEDAKKEEKSAGGNICVDNSTSPSKYSTWNESGEKIKENQNREGYKLLKMTNQCKVDVLTTDLPRRQPWKRARSVPNKNEINSLATVIKRKGKSTSKYKKPMMKPIKKVDAKNVSPNANESFKNTNNKIKTSPLEMCLTNKQNRYLTVIGNSSTNLITKEDCLTADLRKVKRKRAYTAPYKTTQFNDRDSLFKMETPTIYRERRSIKTNTPITFIKNKNEISNFNSSNSAINKLSQLPIDNLRCCDIATFPLIHDKRFNINEFTPYEGRKKILSLPLGNGLSSKLSGKHDFSNMPGKGTLKHKRWLLNNLKETNTGYEDDIFENNSSLHKTAFLFGEESDGSSVNIATPKFECILTPSLPKKTPHFKDCISPSELLQARKSAEEYLYRRNKKRKSENKRSSSGKNTSMNKKNKTKDIFEKKKLDFDEAVNKLIAVQKNLEKNAEIDDEEEDSYFSDASS